MLLGYLKRKRHPEAVNRDFSLYTIFLLLLGGARSDAGISSIFEEGMWSR